MMHAMPPMISCRMIILSTEMLMVASLSADMLNSANRINAPMTLTLNAARSIERRRSENDRVLNIERGLFLCTIVAASFG